MKSYTIRQNDRTRKYDVSMRRPVGQMKIWTDGNVMRLKVDLLTNRTANRKVGELKALFERFAELVNESWELEDNLTGGKRSRNRAEVVTRKKRIAIGELQ